MITPLSRRIQTLAVLLLSILFPYHQCCWSFQVSFETTARRRCRLPPPLIELHDKDDGDGDDDPDIITPASLSLATFQRQRLKFENISRQRQWKQPPNSLLDDPIDFVSALLDALQRTSNHDGGGALVLLQSSTDSWRSVLTASVGVPVDDGTTLSNAQVAPTLQTALERPDNQFAILMSRQTTTTTSTATPNNNTPSNTKLIWHFPSDPLDFHDGTCWVESRLRKTIDETTDELLVAAGWSLERRESDGAWLLDGVDWQDFRENFRPGIGREEWERICG